MAKKKVAETQAPKEPEAAAPKSAEQAMELPSDRESLYEKYDQASGLEEKQPEVPLPLAEVTEPSSEGKEEQPELGTDKTEYTESPTLEETRKAEQEHKTVPLQALHEEREKRKLASARIRELEEREHLLLSDLKTFTQKAPESEQISDYEVEIKTLKAKVNELEQRSRRTDISEKEREDKRYIDTQSTKIKQSMTELEAEGIPVLPWFSVIVADELNRLRLQDPDDPAHDLMVRKMWDDPKEWKRIYNENVLPVINKHTEVLLKRTKDADKEKAKEGAKLAGSPGKALITEKPKDEDYTFDNYMEDRKKTRVT